jgi:hypothetical protein
VTDDQWPAGLERFLAQALQRDPELRFTSAAEALNAWREIMPIAVNRRSSPPMRRPGGEGYHSDTNVDAMPTMTEVQGHVPWDGQHTEGDGYDAPD